uniref:NTR domain-containing protein n=1 Tax=Mola mola TaxID=94237 RepID=A0A3Q4BYD7_MOLML
MLSVGVRGSGPSAAPRSSDPLVLFLFVFFLLFVLLLLLTLGYLITAPLSLRVDAVETVLLQLFGFTNEVRVYVFLKTSMAPNHVVLAQEVVTLNAQNHYQAAAKVRVRHDTQSADIYQHPREAEILITRSNGFLFIQTDKPLYTPHQRVKVRAFSLNQELRPANRSVFLTFKDPDQTTVDIVEMMDVNNGIPSMQNPFKIPIKPKLGIWSIEASYSDFSTTARTDFEVKEYVLPSFSILVDPEFNYISYGQFRQFNFRVSARYLHGAPVANGEVYLRYGYVSGKTAPVLIPSSLSSTGDVGVTVNMEKVLSKHDGPKDLDGVVGKYLYIAVHLQEDTGGISQEAEFASVKFVKSPYSLSLVSTSAFIKPELPYNIQVLVKDHLGKPVNRVQVRLVERRLYTRRGDQEEMPCPPGSTSQSDGLAVFICNTPSEGLRAVLKFETADPALPSASQAVLTLTAVAYHSPNQRYMYIDPPLPGRGLQVGTFANIKVYATAPSYVPIQALSYLVLSKGKVVAFHSQKFIASVDKKHTLSFQVTPAMVPSIRLLVYYILYGEGTSELVADSVWLDVRDRCVNGLQTDMSYRGQKHKPKQNLQLDITTNQEGLVALSAVDTALFTLRPNYRDPVSMVLRHIEHSDLGCGGGGGKDSADVFRLAGLTFITNANTQPLASCTSVHNCVSVWAAQSYGPLKTCCELGMRFIPKSVTCHKFAQQRFRKYPRCIPVFTACCEFIRQHLDGLILGRKGQSGLHTSQHTDRRFYFCLLPNSPGQKSITRPLPDSLTTWQIRAVGMFQNGMCAAEPLEVSVSLPLSVDVPLPYQVVRGEQLELKGSVYNQQIDRIKYCVTLTVGPAMCLLDSQPVAPPPPPPCHLTGLAAGGVGEVTFTVLGLEPGEHTLTFTLRTQQGQRDIVEKKLRVVPEGVKNEMLAGGRLDPQGVYGTVKRIVNLKNKLPPNIVPNTAVERMLTINGEVLGDVLSVVHKPEGLQQLVNLPAGSAGAELGGLLPLVQVYHYLETTMRWDVLGTDIRKSSADLKRKIKEGLVSISSFRRGDSSYSMWMKRESSTWLTALVVKTLSAVDPVVSVDHQALSESVAWLIRNTQQADGSFVDRSSFRPNKAAGTIDQSVYLTSFALMAIYRATTIRDPILQLRHAQDAKSVYVRAVAAYALTLHDSSNMMATILLDRLEKLAREKGHPAVLRYWQETSVTADWLKPDQSSGVTVETTAYVLLTVLLKGRIPYANPILSWLTQDQHYGQGFYSVQDTSLTLEAITEYSRVIPRAVLDQDINVQYSRKGTLGRVQLSQRRPVATPIQVRARPVDAPLFFSPPVLQRTVYYETTASSEKCNFDITVETGFSWCRPLCRRYRPPPNELQTESSLTVMKIQLPTGVEAYPEDLRQVSLEPIVSHYELQGTTVVIQMEAVPSDIFLCVGFRVRTRFVVSGVSESLLSVYEPQDKGKSSVCTKHFSYQEQKLQRLCVDKQCQCMTGKSNVLTIMIQLSDGRHVTSLPCVCLPAAFRVTVKSSAAEGDFMTYTANVVEVLKNTDKGTEVDLVKKVTCNGVDIQNNKQYLVMGASGSEVQQGNSFKYRLPLDSEALVELWPTDCSSPECHDYMTQLDEFALEMQIGGCPESS